MSDTESNSIANNSFENEISTVPVVKKMPHHEQFSLCETRPPYRQGRKLTAVKVYTVNDESKYLVISGIPDIKIGTELSNMCLRYGKIQCLYPLPDYPSNRFELTYLVKYAFVRNARKAKRIIDGKSFFGGVLHVCYAPELESLEETMEKLIDRRKAISYQNIKLGKTSKDYRPVLTKEDLEAKKRLVEDMYSNIRDSASVDKKTESETTNPIKFNFVNSKFSPCAKQTCKKLKVNKKSFGTSKYLSDEISGPKVSSSKLSNIKDSSGNDNFPEENNSTASVESNVKGKNTFRPFKVKSLILTQPSMDYLKKAISAPTDNRKKPRSK